MSDRFEFMSMIASIAKYLTATGTKSVVASITVHGCVLGVAGWMVVARPLDNVRLAGKPIALSVEVLPDEAEPVHVAVTPAVPPTKSVIVSPDHAIVQDKHYRLSPSFQSLESDDIAPPETSELDDADTEELVELDEAVEETLEQPAEEPTELTELPTEAQEVVEAQLTRLAKKKEETLGHEELAPNLSRNTPPSYPAQARRAHLEGTVVLSISISAAGNVTSVAVQQSSGFQILDAAAVNAVQQWRGTPRTRGGVAIDSVETLPITFRLR